MGDSMNIFKTEFVLFFVLINLVVSGCIISNTVCYGSFPLRCTTHTLSCTSPLVIQIINTTYGYRLGCNNGIGISDCTDTTCCNEVPGDCFVPFLSKDNQRVTVNCTGEPSCVVFGFRETSRTKCSRTHSAYSKIEYECVKGNNIKISTSTTYSVTKTTASTSLTNSAPTTEMKTSEMTQEQDETSPTQYSTDKAVFTSSTTQCPLDNTGMVGGVLGTLLIISIVINICVVVYFTRKIKSLSSTPRENNYDGLTNTGRDQPLPTYDDLQVQSTASSNHNDKKKSDRPNSHTYYNTKGDSLSRNIDPYYENMKKP